MMNKVAFVGFKEADRPNRPSGSAPGAETFSSGAETTDWSFQVSMVLQEIRSA